MTTLPISRVTSMPWAIHGPALEVMLDIAAREEINPASLDAWKRHARAPDSPRALADRPGDLLPGSETASLRQGVAIIPVSGPIFRYANLFTAISGATALSTFAADLALARNDSRVTAILLEIDSPGGEVTGMAQAAAAIRAAAAIKPVVAYVEGMAASAAYQLAAAASRIVVASTATVGALGVVTVMTDRRTADARAGITRHEIVSSQTPGKRPDPATDTGRQQMQALIDRLAAEYLDDVAAHRGISVAQLLAATNGGGLVVGADALTGGLADAVGGFEATLTMLAAGTLPPANTAPRAAWPTEDAPMPTDPTETPAAQPVTTQTVTTQPVTTSPTPESPATPPAATAPSPPAVDPVQAERARCAAIHAEAGAAWQALATLAVAEGWTVEQFAAARAASQAAVTAAGQQAAAGAFAASIPPPVAGGGAPAPTDPDAALRTKWVADAKLRAEFGDSEERYLAYHRASAAGRVRLISR